MGGVLATTKEDCLGFSGVEFYRRESGALVAAVTEGLAGAPAAGAPEVTLTGFHFHGIGALLGNGWFGHGEYSLKVGRDIIAEIGGLPYPSKKCGQENQGLHASSSATSA
jgi:hypothetical protein